MGARIPLLTKSRYIYKTDSYKLVVENMKRSHIVFVCVKSIFVFKYINPKYSYFTLCKLDL